MKKKIIEKIGKEIFKINKKKMKPSCHSFLWFFISYLFIFVREYKTKINKYINESVDKEINQNILKEFDREFSELEVFIT